MSAPSRKAPAPFEFTRLGRLLVTTPAHGLFPSLVPGDGPPMRAVPALIQGVLWGALFLGWTSFVVLPKHLSGRGFSAYDGLAVSYGLLSALGFAIYFTARPRKRSRS